MNWIRTPQETESDLPIPFREHSGYAPGLDPAITQTPNGKSWREITGYRNIETALPNSLGDGLYTIVGRDADGRTRACSYNSVTDEVTEIVGANN